MKQQDTCSICGAHTREDHITYTQEFNGSMYVVTGVPAQVCGQCGEHYLSPATVDLLQEIITRGEAQGSSPETIEVPVFHFPPQ